MGEETKHIKRGSQDWLGPLLCSWPALMPQGCTILCLSNTTLSCKQDVTLVCYFKSLLWQDKTKEITHSSDSSVCSISKQYKMYLRIIIYRLSVQDCGVEGHALISSCKSTKIITSCWTTIDRRTLKHTKKDTPCPKAKNKLQPDGRRGTITIKIKSHTCWVGDLQPGEY